MKLDTTPLSFSGLSQRDSQLELKSAIPSIKIATVETEQPATAATSVKSQKSSALSIFGSTFITIFLAELGDKTQLSTLLMSAESQSPWIVFIGAAAALILTSFIGVVLGGWIASKLSPKTVDRAAAVSLLLIAATLIWDVFQG